jgi:hypothetical protein
MPLAATFVGQFNKASRRAGIFLPLARVKLYKMRRALVVSLNLYNDK